MAVDKTAEERRKPYTPAVLRIYGNIEALTQSNTHTGGSSVDHRGASIDIRTH